MIEKIATGEYRRSMTTDRKPPPSRTADQFVLRLPDGMREKVTAAAEEAGRSMNAEFVRRIERSFDKDDSALPLSPEIREKLKAHGAEYGRTLTEEIIHRLDHSFDWEEMFIPLRLSVELAAYRKAHGLDSKQAVDELLTAGLHADAPCVLILSLDGDVEIEKISAALEEAKKRLPEKTVVLVEHHADARPKRAAKKKP